MVEIDGPVVKLELEGACGSCPSSTMTMKMGLERRLMQRIPEISEVVQSIPDGPELTVRRLHGNGEPIGGGGGGHVVLYIVQMGNIILNPRVLAPKKRVWVESVQSKWGCLPKGVCQDPLSMLPISRCHITATVGACDVPWTL